MNKLRLAIVSFLFLGCSPFAPGTVGTLGGVAVVEATKQIYGGVPAGQKVRRRAYVTAPVSPAGRVINCDRSGTPPDR